MHRIDESYPLKSTLLYLGVAVAIDVLALALASRHIPAGAPMLVWGGAGVLVCVPMGRFGVLLSAIAGAAIGVVVAVAARALLHRYQRPAAETVAEGSSVVELLLLAGWLLGAAVAYHVTEVTLFPGFSGMIAASNVLLTRALVYPELVDLYWLADSIPQTSAAGGMLDTVESPE